MGPPGSGSRSPRLTLPADGAATAYQPTAATGPISAPASSSAGVRRTYDRAQLEAAAKGIAEDMTAKL